MAAPVAASHFVTLVIRHQRHASCHVRYEIVAFWTCQIVISSCRCQSVARTVSGCSSAPGTTRSSRHTSAFQESIHRHWQADINGDKKTVLKRNVATVAIYIPLATMLPFSWCLSPCSGDYISTSEAAPTYNTATPPESLANRS